MQASTSKSNLRLLGVGALVLGLSGAGLVYGAPPPAGPVEDIQATLDFILDRLDELEGKIDNQATDLRGVTQNWDKQLDATNGEGDGEDEGCNSDRFTCLWDDRAVRDNETGLVWERAPFAADLYWSDAISHCAEREVGGRKGWQLPLLEQLASLVDTSEINSPGLPTGHPFLNGEVLDGFWSATTVADISASAWAVRVNDGFVGPNSKVAGTSRAWCVRGGQSFDGNTH